MQTQLELKNDYISAYKEVCLWGHMTFIAQKYEILAYLELLFFMFKK